MQGETMRTSLETAQYQDPVFDHRQPWNNTFCCDVTGTGWPARSSRWCEDQAESTVMPVWRGGDVAMRMHAVWGD
jgi:hypothetical protein